MEENDKMNEQQRSVYSKSLMVPHNQCWNTKAVTGTSSKQQSFVIPQQS